MNVWRKIIAASISIAMMVTMFTGIGIINVSATEAVYNFSELTEESYATKNNGSAEIFDGAITLTAAENTTKQASVANFSAAMPNGTTAQFTNALRAKTLAATITLEAGETLVVYYGGTDSKGTAAKTLDMQISDTSTNAVVAEESNAENKEAKPYNISYTSENGGTYKVADKTASNRTLIYAIVVTKDASFNPGGSTVTPTTPPSGESSSPSETATATAAATVTPTPTATATKIPTPSVDPSAQSALEIVTSKGWLETAYVTWTNPVQAEKYNVYVKGENDSDYTKIDDELVRYYGSYYRADAMGLKAGTYTMKVAAVMGGVETDVKETTALTVLAQKREGYAFDPKSPHYNSEGVGGYKNDGTVKDNAQIIYIDDTNKDTVKHTVMIDGKANEGVGLVNILSLREKNKAETTPLIIRMIGQVHSPEGKNKNGYIQIKSTSNVTFEGVGEDAATYNWSFLLNKTDNTEVRNLAVMEFYDDGISLDTDNFNDWIHNCDIFYGQNRGGDQKKGDGSLDVKSGSDYCTFSYNHFWDSGKSSLCGMKEDSYKGYHMTYHHNWFDHSDSRHPRVRGDIVHVYNNYYDGNSKYGAGATTGSNIFMENNAFRNCKYPVLISMQGSDIAGGNTGTFSKEDGGMIKMYGNWIIGGYGVIDAKDDPVEFDAYIADTRDETVPSTYKAKQGESTYSNFDTAADMYNYEPDNVENVPTLVMTYAGRIEGGDFTHEFNNEVDDESYDRDSVLGEKLENYTSTLNMSYISNDYYPSTGGAVPSERPSAAPGPSYDPDATPTPRPTPAPVIMAELNTTWNFGDTPFTTGEGDNVHPDTQYFSEGTANSNGVMRYNISSSSITAENFGGLTYKISGESTDNYQKSAKTFEDGFSGTWQLKSGGAGSASDKVFMFTPKESGAVIVYARSGSSTKDAVLTIAQGQNRKTMTLKNTANEAENLPVLKMFVAAGEQVKIYSDGNTGYYGIAYLDDPDTPTQSATYDKTNKEAVINSLQNMVATVIFAAYDAEGRLTDICIKEEVDISIGEQGVKPTDEFDDNADKVRIFVWDNINGVGALKPLI